MGQACGRPKGVVHKSQSGVTFELGVDMKLHGFLMGSAFEFSIVPCPSSLSHNPFPLSLTIVIFMGTESMHFRSLGDILDH